MDMLAINFTILNGHSTLVLGWMKSNGPAELFARSFAALPAADKAEAACLIAARCVENTFWRPSWWGSLELSHRDVILEEIVRMADSFSFGTADQSLNIFRSAILSEGASFGMV